MAASTQSLSEDVPFFRCPYNSSGLCGAVKQARDIAAQQIGIQELPPEAAEAVLAALGVVGGAGGLSSNWEEVQGGRLFRMPENYYIGFPKMVWWGASSAESLQLVSADNFVDPDTGKALNPGRHKTNGCCKVW